MFREKIALNRLEAALKAGRLAAGAIEKIPGAASLAKRMAALGSGAQRDSAQTRLLRNMRAQSLKDARPLTDRQLRIEELSGEVAARTSGAKPYTTDQWSGSATPRRVRMSEQVRTPLTEAAEGLKRDRTVSRTNNLPHPVGPDVTIGVRYSPIGQDQALPAVTKHGRRKARSALRSTIVHEQGERDSLLRGVGLDRALAALGEGPTRDALHRRKGIIPISTHYDPEPLLRQYASHANMGWGGRGRSSSMADYDTFGVQPLDPSEKALKKIMTRVRPTPTGDFPTGGRHEQAVREGLVKELLAHPKKYHEDLRSAFRYGVDGARLHPDLENYLVQHARKYY